MKTRLIKIAALLMAALMLAGVCACSATDNNPSIGRVGRVSFRLSDYLQYYQTYSSYASYISDFNSFIKGQLIAYGVTLNHCYEIGLTLDEDEEKELAAKVEETIEEQIENMTVDSSITGDEAIRKAKEETFLTQLKSAGYSSLDAYRKTVTEETRKSMLMEKLRAQCDAEVEFGDEQVKEYFDKNADTDKDKYEKDPAAFATAYNNYITGKAVIPLYTPADMFTVKHVLVQFENASEVSDTVEGTFSEDQQKKIDDIRKALEEGVTLEEFIEKFVASGDYNSDTIFVPKEVKEGEEEETLDTNPQLGYREHGYIMNEKLLDKYYEGFGAAACLLYYGKDWTIPVEETENTEGDAETTAEPTEVPEEIETPEDTVGENGEGETTGEQAPADKYKIKFHTTSDGFEIAEVQTNVTNGGVHFIFLAEKLEAGAQKLDVADKESPVYTTIAKFYRETLEDAHYSECYDEWYKNTRIALNDGYLDSYAKNFLGIS
ncbi:MAG: hypothetical protein IK064_02825 [Clostridia bacterium]|nr:hypothetical protein [Clostridia bacterium]